MNDEELKKELHLVQMAIGELAECYRRATKELATLMATLTSELQRLTNVLDDNGIPAYAPPTITTPESVDAKPPAYVS